MAAARHRKPPKGLTIAIHGLWPWRNRSEHTGDHLLRAADQPQQVAVAAGSLALHESSGGHARSGRPAARHARGRMPVAASLALKAAQMPDPEAGATPAAPNQDVPAALQSESGPVLRPGQGQGAALAQPPRRLEIAAAPTHDDPQAAAQQLSGGLPGPARQPHPPLFYPPGHSDTLDDLFARRWGWGADDDGEGKPFVDDKGFHVGDGLVLQLDKYDDRPTLAGVVADPGGIRPEPLPAPGSEGDPYAGLYRPADSAVQGSLQLPPGEAAGAADFANYVASGGLLNAAQPGDQA